MLRRSCDVVRSALSTQIRLPQPPTILAPTRCAEFTGDLLGGGKHVNEVAGVFYGFETYNMLVNPNNPLVKTVLMRVVETAITFSLPLVPTKASLRSDPKLGKKIWLG